MFERVRQTAPEPEGAPATSKAVSGPSADARVSEARRAVLAVGQAKLTVGAVSDPYEREADRVADRVMQVVQRMGRGGAPGVDVAQRCVRSSVRRHAGHQHTEVGHDGGDLSEDLTSRIQRATGGGAPLADTVRGPMESAFGADFSNVRVHTDSDVAPRIAATAFTMGHDIHFAPGAYRPADRSGMWLLSHELTHVVQQTGATAMPDNDLGVHRHFGSCINRHASKEHYMLGSMTPAQIRAIADAKENVEVTAGKGVVKSFKNLVSGPNRPPPAALAEALQSVQEQLTGLTKWRTVAGPADPDPATVVKGDTAYNHTWGGQLVTVACRDGELVCTVGELNALPDFFGSFDDLKVVDRSVAFKTFQVIRRETYIYLKQLEAQLLGRKYSYNTKTEAFTGDREEQASACPTRPCRSSATTSPTSWSRPR